MELQQLRYVVALARELHFQRAAARAHVSQPTLSQQLKKLEEELGSPLFERSPHAVRLSRAGQQFLPYALAVLDQIEKGTREVQSESGRVSGQIRVAAIPTIGPYVLPRVIGTLKKKAPHLQLELYEETTSVLLEHLKAGMIDLGLLSLPIEEPGIVSRWLGHENLYLAVSKNHRLASRKQVTLKQLANESWLILQEGHCFADQMLDFCKRSRKDEQVIFQGSSLLSVMKLAAAGEGITLVPKMAADKKIISDLRFIPFAPPKPKRELGIVWRVSAPLSAAHRLFIQTVSNIL